MLREDITLSPPGRRPSRFAGTGSRFADDFEEELLVTPTGVEPRGELRFQFVAGHSIHGFVFSASNCLGEPQTTPEAVPLWTPLGQIPWDEMWSDDRHWLPLLLEGSDVEGSFLFDGDRLLEHVVVRRPHIRPF